MAWAWAQISQGRVPGGPGTALVFLKLADRADPEGRCWPGHERTAADLGLSASTVRAAISKLDSEGLLKVQRRQVGGRDASNLYHLLIEEISGRVPDFGTRVPVQTPNRVPKFGTESKTGTSHKTQRTGLAAEPVDNQDPEPQGTPAGGIEEIREAREALGLSPGQLGKLANLCKSNNCRLQDVHRALAPHIRAKALRGQQAFLYVKKCLLQNPGRDWTFEARRDAEREAQSEQAEQATQAELARQKFADRLAQAAAAGIAVSNGGRIFCAPPEENPTVFLKYQKPDGTSFLSRIIDFLNAFPEFAED